MVEGYSVQGIFFFIDLLFICISHGLTVLIVRDT